MKYVLMIEATAIEKEIIPEQHYYQKYKDHVIFKKDLLTIFEQKGNQVDFEFTELETPKALNMIDAWRQLEEVEQ